MPVGRNWIPYQVGLSIGLLECPRNVLSDFPQKECSKSEGWKSPGLLRPNLGSHIPSFLQNPIDCKSLVLISVRGVTEGHSYQEKEGQGSLGVS